MNTSDPPPPHPPAKLRARRKPDLGPPKATPPCTECGKRFSSWKALFGHMRCHPERQWRGINPPLQTRRPHFTDDERHVADSLILLSNSPPATAEPTPPSVFWRPNHPKFHLSTHSSPPPSPSPWSNYFLDLNSPPPADGRDGGCGLALDLKLGV